MEPSLAHHKATPNRAGNHFNRADLASRARIVRPDSEESDAARVDRIMQAKISNARKAGMSLARWAVRNVARDHVDCRQADVLELLLTQNSLWIQQFMLKECVHELLEPLALYTMRQELRKRGWRL